MSKKLEITVFIIIIVVLSEWGEHIFPTKLEISDVQIVEAMGMDLDENNKVSLSLLFEESENEVKEGRKKEKLLTVSSESFLGTEKGMRYYEDKIFIGSHVKNIIIGEKLAQENLVRVMEYIGKNGELRLDSNIYIAKGSSASKLFEDGLGNEYGLADKINDIAMTEVKGSKKRCVKVIDVIKLLLSNDKVGVIPCIQLVDNGGNQFEGSEINMSEQEKKRIELAGYGVIKKDKLTGYLGNYESSGYDYVKNSIFEENVVLAKDDEVIGLKLIDSDTKIKCEFSDDTLTKAIIKIKVNNSIMETSSGKNIFAKDLKTIEELENNYIKNIVMATIEYAQKENADFIGIGKSLELKHPYKWRNIEKEWEKIFPTLPIEVEVNSKINEEYGILSTTNES